MSHFILAERGEAAVLAVGAGRIVYGSSASPDLTVFDLQGKKVGNLETGVPQRRATEANYEAAIDHHMSTIARSEHDAAIRAIFKRTPMPELVPAYQDAFVDPRGNVWVVTSTFGDGVTEFRVFPSAGTEAVTLRLPVEVKVLEVGDGYLLAKYTDPDAGTRVQVYRTESTPAEVR